jgi:short-subunit dehydrogenase
MTEVFAGATAVVTGAASGIGASLTTSLLRCGATVFAADRDAAGLDRLMPAGPGELVRSVIDVTDPHAVRGLIDRAADHGGHLDYVFNNAGIVVGGNFEDMDEAAWRAIVDVNVWGVIYGTQFAYARMITQGSGHIVNTASTAGVLPVARSTAYASTKHAVIGLSTSLREEASKYGVKVSVVVPGLVDTNIFATAHNLNGYDYARAVERVPFGKVSPQRAADYILAGVAKNRRVITFPAYNRVIISLYRMFPTRIARLINTAPSTAARV